MKLKRATHLDDEDLKTFFNQQTIAGLFDYQIQRPNSFFDHYKLTTDDFETFMLKDDAGNIQAIVSILFKKAYINHQEQTVGYVTDLRVARSREATLNWAQTFMPAVQEARRSRECEYIFSDLEQYESKASNLLLRRRNRDIKLPRYHLFQKFFLCVVYGKRFFADKPLSSIKIDYGRTEDLSSISRYLREKSVRRPLRYNLTEEELERRCRSWPNFSAQNFLVARNNQGEIIGCMAPWNNSDVQRIVPQKYHDKSFRVYSTSKTLSLLSLTRPLPNEGNAFRVKHITHSACNNPDIFYSLLSRAYDDCQNKELIVYPNYIGDYSTRPPASFVSVKIPYGFYTLLDQGKKLPSFLHPNPFQRAPDFQYSYF